MINFDSSKKTILITGTSRGLGEELAKQFSYKNWNVIAGIRNNNGKKFESVSKNFIRVQLDVNKSNDIKNLVNLIGENRLDAIINNAGIYFKDKLESISIKNMIEMYKINTIAPLIISQNFLHCISKSKIKIIAVITSRMGSFGNSTGGESYGYRASKAAANMVVKTMSLDLESHGIKILALHPGWVQTEMGGNNAIISVAESASGIKEIIINSSNFKNGGYYNYKGEKLEW